MPREGGSYKLKKKRKENHAHRRQQKQGPKASCRAHHLKKTDRIRALKKERAREGTQQLLGMQGGLKERDPARGTLPSAQHGKKKE